MSFLIFDGLVLEGLHNSIEIFKKFKTIALIHHPLYLEFKGKKSSIFFDRAKKIYKHINYFIVTSKQTKKLLVEKFENKQTQIKVESDLDFDSIKIFGEKMDSLTRAKLSGIIESIFLPFLTLSFRRFVFLGKSLFKNS